MDRKTARKYRDLGQLPSEALTPHSWRTRADPLVDVWSRLEELLQRGRSNAEIARQLFLSVATVKAHITHILTKLELGNRTQIALLAHDAGLA